MEKKGVVAGPLSVLCSPALVMGTTSAAASAPDNTAGNTSAGPVRHHPPADAVIATLQENGACFPGAGADLGSGDSPAGKAWLNTSQTLRPVRTPPDLTNDTRQQETIMRLGEEGVDVTAVSSALREGDPATVKAWPGSYFRANPPERPAPPDLSVPVEEQRILSRLGERGMNTTSEEADLRIGDTTAVQTWLETYLYSHEGEMACHRPPQDAWTVNGTGVSR